MLEYFTETTNPSNRRKFICEDKIDDIIIGGTTTHVFDLAFVYSDYVQDCKVTYKQGLDVVLEKNPTDNPDTFLIDENDTRTIITVILTPDDTLKFTPNYLDVKVQLKILNNKTISSEWSGEYLYNRAVKLKLETPLDYEDTEGENTK